MIGNKHTAAPEHLFRTDEESSKLSKDMEELVHKIIAQVLWIVGKRGRSELQLGQLSYVQELQHQMNTTTRSFSIT